MAGITYEQLALGWKPDSRSDNVFNIIAIVVLLSFLLAALVVSSIPVPKNAQSARTVLPDRIAKFITERPKPKVVPRPVPKPLPLPSPLVRAKKPEQKKALTKIEKKARDNAEKSGLLALTTQLSDLMDTKSINKMVSGSLHAAKNANAEVSVNSQILTANSSKGSGGVTQNVYMSTAMGGTRLDDNQIKLANKLLAAHGQIAVMDKHVSRTSEERQARGDNVRAEEDVAYVMDEHKSMLHALYRRARRTHPGIKGKIVLELTILPTGRVSRVRVVTSELNDRRLEQQLIERIKLFDFGARQVETLTLTIPVEFLPS